jgi:hypothetical protein
VLVRGPGNAVVNVKGKGQARTTQVDESRLMTIDRNGAHLAGD